MRFAWLLFLVDASRIGWHALHIANSLRFTYCISLLPCCRSRLWFAAILPLSPPCLSLIRAHGLHWAAVFRSPPPASGFLAAGFRVVHCCCCSLFRRSHEKVLWVCSDHQTGVFAEAAAVAWAGLECAVPELSPSTGSPLGSLAATYWMSLASRWWRPWWVCTARRRRGSKCLSSCCLLPWPPRAGSCCWRLPTLPGQGQICSAASCCTVLPLCHCNVRLPAVVYFSLAGLSHFIPFPCPAPHRRTRTHWHGCRCTIMTSEAPRSTMTLSCGSTNLCCRRCGTLTLGIVQSRPLSGQHVHSSLRLVKLDLSCCFTSDTWTLAWCWSVGRLRTQRVGLESGEQPGVTLRLSSVALLGCRIASPTCTVLRACESSLVWPGRTQCRLVAVATTRVLCYDNGPVLIRSVTRAIGQGLPRCGDKQLRQKKIDFTCVHSRCPCRFLHARHVFSPNR